MSIRRIIRARLATVLAIVALTAIAKPQAAGQTPAETAQKPGISVKVDVVLSRWQGEKKVSSLPFALYMVTPVLPAGTTPQDNRRWANQSVRMGVDVPVGTMSRVSTAGQAAGPSTTTTGPDYRNVGTSIDGRMMQMEDGRFSVSMSVQDTSIFTNDGSNSTQIRMADPMAFRTFTMNNVLTMRDGQTLPFAMASDKITGDIIKVEVTLTVLK